VTRSAVLAILAAASAAAGTLEALPEYLRPDPFGGIVAADRAAGGAGFLKSVRLEAARGGYVSCHLVVKLPEKGPYRLRVEFARADRNVQADLFREWFHRHRADKRYYPDALIPVRTPHASAMPEADNRIEAQTAQAYWLDLWVAPDAAPGVYQAAAVLEAGGRTSTLPIELRVIAATVPAEDAITMDHNSYGLSWMPEGDVFERIHAYHRIFYEHRGAYHQLGYGHGGKVGPEFAPVLTGAGRSRRVADWSPYDRHYGPLLDGSAFADTRRGARPIPFVYLPINPEWPASFLNWGEPGYEVEFVNVVSEMERHFREKGWTRTKFELFFNHKKRYKAFPWDGDEPRFAADLAYPREYARLLKKAVPADSPVQFVFRADASWMMERQFQELAGVINFWVCSGGMFAWYDYAPKLLKDRGDIVWIYGGTPAVGETASAVTAEPLRTWMLGVNGFCRWQTVAAGRDPWFDFDGGGTALVYAGDRFQIAGPVPSLRLKLQRNAVQDITLLASLAGRRPLETLKADVAYRYKGLTPKDWWTPRPALADTNVEEWSNAGLARLERPAEKKFANLDADAWQRVRDYVLHLAREVR
jgi:hypothetical protein